MLKTCNSLSIAGFIFSTIFAAEYQIKGNVYRFCSRFQTTNFDGRVDGRGFMRYDELYSLCQLLKIDRNDGWTWTIAELQVNEMFDYNKNRK